jgi:nitrite reductase (NADH) small subunit
MGQWVRIGAVGEMPAEGSLREFAGKGVPLCVARIGGELAALENECPHRGASLAEGAIEDGHIVCPWHGWCFDPKTGAELMDPQSGARVFPLRVDGDDVLCEV